MTRFTIFVCTALLCMASVAPVAAQESDSSVEARIRNNCRRAARVLASDRPHRRTEWARAYIVDCEDEGPAYFARRWASVPADTATLREMIFGSTRIRDARVYASLRQTALDASRPDAVRVAAMIALAEYAFPHISFDLSMLRPPDGPIERIRIRGGTSIHVVHVPGAQRLGPVTPEVIALLNSVAADRSGEPREVWYAAAVLARRVQGDADARANRVRTAP